MHSLRARGASYWQLFDPMQATLCELRAGFGTSDEYMVHPTGSLLILYRLRGAAYCQDFDRVLKTSHILLAALLLFYTDCAPNPFDSTWLNSLGCECQNELQCEGAKPNSA